MTHILEPVGCNHDQSRAPNQVDGYGVKVGVVGFVAKPLEPGAGPTFGVPNRRTGRVTEMVIAATGCKAQLSVNQRR